MEYEIVQHKLQDEFGRIVQQLDQGDTFVVTRKGAPVGEMTPLPGRWFASADTAIALFEGAPEVDYQRFRADMDAIIGLEPVG